MMSQHGQLKGVDRGGSGLTTDSRCEHSSSTGFQIAERAVRRVKEGPAKATVQSGLPEECCDCTLECHCVLRNVHDKLVEGKRQQAEQTLNGLLLRVRSKRQLQTDLIRRRVSTASFRNKIPLGVHTGRVSRAGGGRLGDLLIATAGDLGKPVSLRKMNVQRSNHEEISQEGNPSFSCADGSFKVYTRKSLLSKMKKEKPPEQQQVPTFQKVQKTVEVPGVMTVHTIRTVQKTVKVPQVQLFDRTEDVPVVTTTGAKDPKGTEHIASS